MLYTLHQGTSGDLCSSRKSRRRRGRIETRSMDGSFDFYIPCCPPLLQTADGEMRGKGKHAERRRDDKDGRQTGWENEQGKRERSEGGGGAEVWKDERDRDMAREDESVWSRLWLKSERGGHVRRHMSCIYLSISLTHMAQHMVTGR